MRLSKSDYLARNVNALALTIPPDIIRMTSVKKRLYNFAYVNAFYIGVITRQDGARFAVFQWTAKSDRRTCREYVEIF